MVNCLPGQISGARGGLGLRWPEGPCLFLPLFGHLKQATPGASTPQNLANATNWDFPLFPGELLLNIYQPTTESGPIFAAGIDPRAGKFTLHAVHLLRGKKASGSSRALSGRPLWGNGTPLETLGRYSR